MVYCFDINGLFGALGQNHSPEHWRLFIDGSVTSLKAVLLHNGNLLPSIPIVYATKFKENYENLKLILEKINYAEYMWPICSDLKVVGMLTGLKGGFAKNQCFLCLWEGRQRHLHYIGHKWPSRIKNTLGMESVINAPLVGKHKIILPPLHIKLGLVRNFVRALKPDSEPFRILKVVFPRLTKDRIEAGKICRSLTFIHSPPNEYSSSGVFIGPQIKKMYRSALFEASLTKIEKEAWNSMKDVVENFLGNYRAPNYVELIDKMLTTFREMGVNMSLKIHFLADHLDFFPSNLGKFSDEHGERFHQDIAIIENRFKGKDLIAMMSEYMWYICRSTDQADLYRQPTRKTFKVQLS